MESVSVRCLPAKTRRRSEDGRLVRSARRDFRVEMEVLAGSVRGMADAKLVTAKPGRWITSVLLWPAKFLTKIWTVSAASEDVEDKEEMEEDREERMVAVVGRWKLVV